MTQGEKIEHIQDYLKSHNAVINVNLKAVD